MLQVPIITGDGKRVLRISLGNFRTIDLDFRVLGSSVELSKAESDCVLDFITARVCVAVYILQPSKRFDTRR